MVMETNEETTPAKPKWYSIREAAEYLDVGEPTLYRWMRDGKLTYRKVGDSTRFWQQDLDSVMQVFHSDRDLETAREVCPVCRHTELVEGKVRGAGLVYFVPKKTKFWTFKDSFVDTTARMCTRCAYSGDCRTLIPISVGQHSDFRRTPFRFISDSVPG